MSSSWIKGGRRVRGSRGLLKGEHESIETGRVRRLVVPGGVSVPWDGGDDPDGVYPRSRWVSGEGNVLLCDIGNSHPGIPV